MDKLGTGIAWAAFWLGLFMFLTFAPLDKINHIL